LLVAAANNSEMRLWMTEIASEHEAYSRHIADAEAQLRLLVNEREANQGGLAQV